MDRVKKPIRRVLGYAAVSVRRHSAEQGLPGKNQGEHDAERSNRRNTLLLVDVAALQKAADLLGHSLHPEIPPIRQESFLSHPQIHSDEHFEVYPVKETKQMLVCAYHNQYIFVL